MSFQGLATHGFFRNLWELLERYGILFRLHADFDIPLLQERDRTLMEAVCETGIFTKQEIISINCTRHYKGVHSIGDMTYSDGLSMDLTMYTRRTLGKYTGRPHRPDDWFVSSDLLHLYHKVATGGHEVYNRGHTA